MVQDHLDLRAAREEETAWEHGAPVAGPDGITRNRVETGHGRLLATLFGTVRVTWCAWRRPGQAPLPGRCRLVAAGAPALPCPGPPGRPGGSTRLVRDRARRDHRP